MVKTIASGELFLCALLSDTSVECLGQGYPSSREAPADKQALWIVLGIAGVGALWILVRSRRAGSDSGGIIGIDHVDRPRTGSYGGGFIPGGLLSRGGLGTQLGVWGAGGAEAKGPRKEYAEERKTLRSKTRRRMFAAAIRKAEARTGHQILAVIGPLEEDRVAKADRIAAQWPAASIVVCIDPVSGAYEVRWRDPSFALDAAHLATLGYMMRHCKFAKAITLLADVLPVKTLGAELPDIIED
jgi:hypothetical protein